MAWTTPRDWTTGELVTSALLNTHVRDNLTHVKWANDRLLAETVVTTNQTGTGAPGDTVATLGAVAIPSTVGAVYAEAWGRCLYAENPTSSPWYANAYIVEAGAGYIAGVAFVSSSGDGAPGGQGFYMRSRDFAWGNSTKTVTLELGGLNADGAILADASTPLVLRLVRSY